MQTPPLWGRRLRLLGRNDVQNTPPTLVYHPYSEFNVTHVCILIDSYFMIFSIIWLVYPEGIYVENVIVIDLDLTR